MAEDYKDVTGVFILNNTEKGVELQEQFFNRKKGFYYKKRDFIAEYSRKWGGKTIANSLILKRDDVYHVLHDFSYINHMKTGICVDFWFSEKAETQEEAVLIAKKWVNRNIKNPSKELERLDRLYFWLGDEEPED